VTVDIRTATEAEDAVEALTAPLLAPLFWPAERVGAPSAWWLHVPFAHWIVAAARPNVLVELGTHAGVSYSAFCNAVQRAGLPTRCHAIDTWRGDAHASAYDDSVFNEFSHYHNTHFSAFSTLIRCSFDEALGCIEDGSVDLLHIDGLHTFEAVRHDYDSWLPKLSDRAVIIFHDINERSGDFGVWRLWQELCDRHPNFTFLHGHGLGVLAVGERVPGPVLDLCGLRDPGRVATIRQRFFQIGERWLAETRQKMTEQHLGELSQSVEQRAESARALAEMEAARALAEMEAARALAAMRAQLQGVLARSADLERQYNAITSSTAWRASGLLRWFGARMPGWVRRSARRGVKLVWWTVTLKLPNKIAQRRRLIAAPGGAVYRMSTSPTAPTPALPALWGPGPQSASAPSLVYISGEPETPGHAYRVKRFVTTAAEIGARAAVIDAAEIAARRNEIEGATILVIWRARWSPELADAVTTARRAGACIVFDVDDLMIDAGLARIKVIDGIRSQGLTEDAVAGHYAAVRETMLSADLCFTTTEELAFHMRGSGKRTHVLPNGFDHVVHDVSRQARRDWQRTKTDALIRIGYAGGSRTHQRDFGLAAEAIGRLLRENADCRLVLFCTPDSGTPLIDADEYPALAGLADRIEWRPLQPIADLPTELARFDINLAPLEFGNPFCEAKSELKFWEAALVEVPTVASPTGPFRRAIAHGKTGLLAASADDWYVQLSQLVVDPEMRRNLGRQAYHKALATFGPMQRALRFGRVLEQLRGGLAGANAFALDAHLMTREQQPPQVFPSDVVFEQPGLGNAEVTVIIPLYNYEGYVVEALKSVHQQTLKLLDLVIVDGCSTDNSLAVAKAWAERNASRFNRLVVLKNRANYGLGFCRNSGFDAADTAYVLPLDADNKLLPECCETLLREIREARVAYVYPKIQHFGNSSAIINDQPYDPQGFVAGNYIDAMALVAKEAWAMVGGYNHIRHGWEDYDFWCRLAEIGLRGTWWPEVLAQYRVHRSSMMTQQTTVPENYRRLFENFHGRHPWVALGEQHTSRQLPSPQPHMAALKARTRLDTLLPILRCPQTKQKLAFNESRTALVSVDGLRSWPILEGRPLLSPDLVTPEIKSRDHISNELPEIALDLIRTTSGLVLNLSAGGSRERCENVVEVEYAIFRHTDIVTDAHELPFDDETFESVIVMNAFEHYREPHKVAAELHRVLKPGGRILIRTAFLQPLHERPWHFYNCTRYGLAEWFKAFETDVLHVSDNFCPNHSIAWLASESEAALRSDVSASAADAFAAAPVGALVEVWRDPSRRATALWTDFQRLTQTSQEITAAGFEFLGHKPPGLPDLR
jgi:GT2 family glycosyltransferase/glycosyltransferase involved in cell wall biosynthesis/SAM-dependent methyltransferase/uncharacterized protein YbaR (Trm112 family)